MPPHSSGDSEAGAAEASCAASPSAKSEESLYESFHVLCTAGDAEAGAVAAKCASTYPASVDPFAAKHSGSRTRGKHRILRVTGNVEAGAVEGKYAASYSASVDPFAAWRARAADERRAAMGVHDRWQP